MAKAQNNVDSNAIKKPGDDVPLTKEQQDEWEKCADDPFYFFTNYCMVRGSKGKVLFQPRVYQEDLLNVVINNTHSVVISPRQSGKCSAERERVDIRVDGVVLNLSLGELHELISQRKGLNIPNNSDTMET